MTIKEKRAFIQENSVELEISLLSEISDVDYEMKKEEFFDENYDEFASFVEDNPDNWNLLNDNQVEEIFENNKTKINKILKEIEKYKNKWVR